MQQKIIPLVLSLLVSGAAAAQSNVSIYGTLDMGFSHRGDNLASGIGSKNEINSSQATDSLIGFRGEEDLGGGLKALFVLEAGFHADDGNHNDSQLFDEQVYVGLSGDFGTVLAGRLSAPRNSFLSEVDPFAGGMVGNFGNLYGDVDLADVDTVDNAVAYVSPSWSGFSVTAAYANQAIGQENLGNDGDIRVYTILPRYTNGPLDIGFSYQLVKGKDSASDLKNKQWTLGATYDFDVVKLAASYDRFKGDHYQDGALDDDLQLKTWMIGVTVPFGRHAVLASYSQSKRDWLGANDKSKQWALGYTYSFSKRTNLYAAYADIQNDGARSVDLADSANEGNGYQNGFQFGVVHTF